MPSVEIREISCSVDRPPKTTATLIFDIEKINEFVHVNNAKRTKYSYWFKKFILVNPALAVANSFLRCDLNKPYFEGQLKELTGAPFSEVRTFRL